MVELSEHLPHCLICAATIPAERAKLKGTTCSDEHRKERKARLRTGNHSCCCIWCGDPVPKERQRYRAITCCEEHGRLRKASIRARVDQRQCRVCRKPSSPQERAAYRRFRSLEITAPELLYPKPWKQWQQNGGTVEGFRLAIGEQLSRVTSEDTMGGIDLGLIDFRSKEAPGGAKSGRKPLKPKEANIGEPEETTAEHDGLSTQAAVG
jgi:hypothetical protein